jgi:hypothetical protein
MPGDNITQPESQRPTFITGWWVIFNVKATKDKQSYLCGYNVESLDSPFMALKA